MFELCGTREDFTAEWVGKQLAVKLVFALLVHLLEGDQVYEQY